MQTAIRLARRGEGRVEPNPMVGCVVVRNGHILGQGYHKAFGGPHAEVEALADCCRRGHSLDDATVYVTLEPCCHHGKTPPCTKALIAARPARVIVAMLDPAEHAKGAGVEALRNASITVEVGPGQTAAQRLTEPYTHRVTTETPWVIAKWAQTVDGRIATRTGESRWISAPSSRRFVHRLRSRVDAVMVGIGTVLADNPRLTARNTPIRRHARRVVIDPMLRIPDKAVLFSDPAPPITIAMGPDADTARAAHLKARGVELFEMAPSACTTTGLDLTPLLDHLAKAHGATNVLVEGGSRLLGNLLAQRLIDQCLVFTAPMLMGDPESLPALSSTSVEQMKAVPRLQLVATRRFDEDVLLDYRCVK